jgi:hypothetical protein
LRRVQAGSIPTRRFAREVVAHLGLARPTQPKPPTLLRRGLAKFIEPINELTRTIMTRERHLSETIGVDSRVRVRNEIQKLFADREGLLRSPGLLGPSGCCF